MPDYSRFFPLFGRTETEIRADFDARANAGLTPDDPDWVETRVGSFYWLATQPMVVNSARQIDRMNEIAASAIVATSWGDYLDQHAESYGTERIAGENATGDVTFTGENGTLIGTGVHLSPEQVDPDIDPPIFETTASGAIASGTLTLPVVAIEPGEDGNVSAGEITLLLTGVDDVASVTNADDFTGGSEAETDEELVVRLRVLFQGANGGNIAQYEAWALSWNGVGRVLVIPVWDGADTVKLVVSDDAGNPVSAGVVSGLQDWLDPTPGQGQGRAPITHVVTVETPTPVVVDVSAVLDYEPGYSFDGAADTVALGDAVAESIRAYIDGLEPAADVIYNHVLAACLRVEGVTDVTALTLNGDTDPIVIDNDPMQVARAGDVDVG